MPVGIPVKVIVSVIDECTTLLKVTLQDVLAGRPLSVKVTVYPDTTKFAVIVPDAPIVAVVDADVSLAKVMKPVLLAQWSKVKPA